MRKSVGIVTFHRAHNSGAMLQAYALQTILRQLGFDAFCVECEGLQPLKPWPKLESRKDLLLYPIRLISMLGLAQLKYGRFCAFGRRFIEERKLDIMSDRLEQMPDVLVVGSDQVWNPQIVLPRTPIYLLEKVLRAKKISYAASFGIASLSEEYRARYADALKDFKSISVREDAGARIVRDLLGRDAEVVLDPTMLLDATDYAGLEAPQLVKEKYLCVYCPAESDALYRFAKKVAKRLNLKLVNVQNGRSGWMGCHWGDHRAASPDRFLSLIKNSELVITDSFHATVFSILYNRPFMTFNSSLHRKLGSRLQTLLTTVGLPDHFVDEGSDIENIEAYAIKDYEYVRERILQMREKSLAYLRRAIAGGGE